MDLDVLKDLHQRMVRIRLFEEEAGRLMEAGQLPGFLHLYVGEEAVAAGVIAHLSNADQVSSTHRGHGHMVAKGGDMKLMFAELFGRATGYCKGRGGSMHVSDLSLGMLGANGIVGGGVPIAVGAGFANAYLENGAVSVTFFGDGASNIGAFHEAANMAGALKLPVVFVCENNLYGEYTRQTRHQAITDIADRAHGYGMPGLVVDGMDVVAVYEGAGEAIARARSGEGPSMVEAKTYRYYDHSGVTGMRFHYRTEEEVTAWKARDPIDSLESRMIAGEAATREQLNAVWDEVRSEVADAVAYGESSPQPDVAGLLDDVYTVAAP
ncbi:MAG TPA: thiamine pyrophosphate-dependent dehydrogenase E1 component subunit alpha [Acidimicrobiales bacterium]|nr:thiamine pyrophosphate-dependent dehydrogenase E1 component subunit alpha [Acidimicrobiales bacterium]